MATVLTKSQFHFYYVNNSRQNVVYVTPSNRHFYICGISVHHPVFHRVNDFDKPAQSSLRELYNYIVSFGVKHNKKFIPCQLKN